MNRLPLAVTVASTALGVAIASAADAPSSPRQRAQGAQLFARYCVACHGTMKVPGTFALQIKYKGEVPADLRQRQDLTPEVVAAFVRQGIGSMPPFRKTEISDAELAAIGAYLTPAKTPARRR